VTDASLARIALIAVLGSLTIWTLLRHPVPLLELKRRLPRCIAGLACFGIGISFFFSSTLGTGPWDVLHGGLARRTGLPTGVIINLLGIALLPIWIPLKERVGLGTVLNALVIGFVVDLVKPRLFHPTNLVIRVAFAVIGLFVIALGSGLYIGSGLGAGPRDGLMMGLKRLGMSVRTARTVIEAATLGIGWLLGGKIGFGTVLFLVGIGPLVQYSLKKLTLPPLPRFALDAPIEPVTAPHTSG
jgi:uncharacterized membrane protein YczE